MDPPRVGRPERVARRSREAAALRANLHRRKAQERGRDAASPLPDKAEPPDGDASP